MKLRIVSDIHLENCPFRLPVLPDDHLSVLILAGDIGQISQRNVLEPFIRDLAGRFAHVIYVMGNHEYYDGVFPDSRLTLKRWNLPANVHILEKDTVDIDDVSIVGATLWTDFNRNDPQCVSACLEYLPDFRHTLFHAPGPSGNTPPVHLTPAHQLEEHRQTRTWLAATLHSLHTKGRKTVLVTHHGVSWRSALPREQNLPTTGGIVSDLTDLLLAWPPALCIHGHTHESFDYRLGTEKQGTRVITNPRGTGNPDGTQENNRFNFHYCLTV